MATQEVKTCAKCNRTMNLDNYYISKKTDIYPPDGRLNICKKCLTMHVNNWEPSTYQNILQIIDVPFIESEWNALLERYGKDPKKLTSVSIIGRYLAKMKLKQYSDYNYADTESFMEKENAAKARIKAQEESQKNRYAAALQSGAAINMTEEELSHLSEEEISELFPEPDELVELKISFDDELTDEEKRAMSLKWGKLYRAEEWIKLEQFYQEMMESYDIQTASHNDYLMKICKTSLKMDQAIDCGDVDGFQKLSKVYDTLMKSAKFTAAQNKAESDNFVDSIGEMVALCEQQGFIPKFHTDEPKDIVDLTLQDMNRYIERLVKGEMQLGNMIESALTKMKIEEEKEEEELDDNDDFISADEQNVLEDVDYADYGEFIDTQKEMDEDIANKVGGQEWR